MKIYLLLLHIEISSQNLVFEFFFTDQINKSFILRNIEEYNKCDWKAIWYLMLAECAGSNMIRLTIFLNYL